MVAGLEHFRAYFAAYQDNYVLIGGVACYLMFEEAGLDFRATKDLDIVLCSEALSTDFVAYFWQYVKDGGYQIRQKSSGEKQFYRFDKPSVDGFPAMLELFSRAPQQLDLAEDASLTPLPVDDDVSSLSAILLDDDYYQCIAQGREIIRDVPVLGLGYILPFKVKAWLDLSQRKTSGESVDSKVIKKHLNDVFRLSQLLASDYRVELTAAVRNNMHTFIEAMANGQAPVLKDFGIAGDVDDVLDVLRRVYQIESS